MSEADQLLTLDPKLVFDLAARVETPAAVAAKYGLDPQYLAEVMESPHVQRVISAKRKELDDANFALTAKAKLMFEDLLPDIYKKAKSENTTLSGVLEAAKFMRTVAGLDKQDPSVAQQEKFSITIQFGGAPANVRADQTRSQTVDVVATEVIDDLGRAPAYLSRAQASNAELEYVEQ